MFPPHDNVWVLVWCGTDAGGNKASLVQFSEISYKHRHQHQLSPAAVGGGRRGGNLSHGPYTGGQWVAANTELGDTLQLPVDKLIKIWKICSHV